MLISCGFPKKYYNIAAHLQILNRHLQYQLFY